MAEGQPKPGGKFGLNKRLPLKYLPEDGDVLLISEIGEYADRNSLVPSARSFDTRFERLGKTGNIRYLSFCRDVNISGRADRLSQEVLEMRVMLGR